MLVPWLTRNLDVETADAGNNATCATGFVIPETFEELPQVLKATLYAVDLKKLYVARASLLHNHNESIGIIGVGVCVGLGLQPLHLLIAS